MTRSVASNSLPIALARYTEKILKPRSTVLFRRGEPALGLFIIHRGLVSLDFGSDSKLINSFGSGAVIGLPETLARRPYSMTATVTQDAQLGFLSAEALDLLLRRAPELCQQLLPMLGEKLAEAHRAQKLLLHNRASVARQ